MSISEDVRAPVLSRKCHVPGCGATSPAVVVYSAKRTKDEAAFRRWLEVLGINDERISVHACQRHFPAGAPTRNHPDPNPNLFNPIPVQAVSRERLTFMTPPTQLPPIFNTAPDGTPLGPDGQPLANPIQPPPGSVTKLAPNATLIDLNKIRKDQDVTKPFKIEQVTVLIDESDAVKRAPRVYRDHIDPMSLGDEELIEKFGFPKDKLLIIFKELEEYLERPTKRSHAMPPNIQVLSALQYYVSCSNQYTVSATTGLSQPSICRVLEFVTECMFRKAVADVKMPKTHEEMFSTMQKFYEIGSPPNIVGVIDTTHIEVKGPVDEKELYVNHDGVCTLNVQFVCNPDHTITNFVAKFPGSVEDSHVWKESNLRKRFVAGEFGNSYLVGDTAYTLDPYLLTPIQHPKTPAEEAYNYSHRRAIDIAQRTAILLKSRFKCLHKSTGPLLYEPTKCAKVIIACIWLHNKCIEWKIPLGKELESDEPSMLIHAEPWDPNHPGLIKRRQVVQNVFPY